MKETISSLKSLTPQGLPNQIDVDFLLPNGFLITIQCCLNETLLDLRCKLLTNVQNLINALKNYEFKSDFNLKSLESEYIFVSISQDAKELEFYDLSKRLGDLNLFFPLFKLVKNEGNVEEKAYNCDLCRVTGLGLNELNWIDVDKLNEVNDYRYSLFKLLLDENKKTDSSVSYSPNLDVDLNDILETSYAKRAQKNDQFLIDIDIHHESENQVFKLTGMNPENLTPIDLLNELENLSPKLENYTGSNYVLKVCGCDEFLLGNSTKLISYKVGFKV
jgi:hypothetical protein